MRFLTLLVGALAGPALVAQVSAGPVLVKPNGGWCWFQDERAIIVDNQLIFGTIAGAARDGSSPGDAVVSSVDLQTGIQASFTLHPGLQTDDHAVPAFLALPDGRVLATYQVHGSDDLMRWRHTLVPGDISNWTDEHSVSVGASVSYSNPFQLGSENGRILLFHRGVGYNPNYLVSDDDGETFRYGGRLLAWSRPVGRAGFTGIDGGRPYLKYAQQGDDTIHVIATQDHPRAFDNGIFHGYLRHGNWYASDGRLLAPLSRTKETSLKPTDLTPVFRGDADHVAWMADLHVDGDGRPRILFSVQREGAPYRGERNAGNDGQDHRYHYARWDGEQWRVQEIAHAGRRLYPGEDDYTGLGAIDPQEPDVVFISTDADPDTGTPLISGTDGRRHWEIFKGRTDDGGNSWSWAPVTRNSTEDNLRPIIPIWRAANGRRVVLWLRGSYRSYTDFDLDVMGLLPERGTAPSRN